MNNNFPDINILPITAQNINGSLSIGGCELNNLVENFGTPLYVYDEDTIRSICKQFTVEFNKFYQPTKIEYSTKAFSNPVVNKIIDEEGLDIDVVTGGELAVAIASDFPSGRINFHGNNKSEIELQEAIEYGIGTITIDSFHEINLLEKILKKKSKIQKVMIRVSPSIDPHTHLLTTTGILDSKFGFSIETGDAEEAIKRVLKINSLELLGVHFHLGSPIFELDPYVQAIEYVIDFCAKMRDSYGFQLSRFSPGGGFAIGYLSTQLPPDISEYAKVISDTLLESCEKYNFNPPELIVEPGRAIVGRSGVAIYTVGSIKEIPGVRTYVSVDGGMGDNIRPAIYGSEYSVIAIEKINQENNNEVTISGKFCESGDILAKDVLLPDLTSGDLLALPSSGAYCIGMSSNYNMQVRPAVLLVKDGIARLIKRRETYEDLLSTSINID